MTQKGGPKTEFQCETISREQRNIIFKTLWETSTWEAKKTFVKENVMPTAPKYRRINAEESRKKQSFRYNLTVTEELINENASNKVKKQVCKKNVFKHPKYRAKTFKAVDP